MQIRRIHFETIDSTNNWPKRNLNAFSIDEIVLITADEQTLGRGRYQNRWESPPKQNIYASFCFFETAHLNLGNLPKLLSITAVQMIEKLGFSPKIKWPNDVLISGKKVSGCLCEGVFVERNKFIVAGIGININMPSESLQKINKPATSLYIESGKKYDIEELVRTLQNQFLCNFTSFSSDGFKPFWPRYIEKLYHQQGVKMSFRDHEKLWEGSFHSILSDGSLNMLLPNGQLKNFYSGEIFL